MTAISEAHADFVRSEEGHLLREDVLSWGAWYGPHDWFRDHDIGVLAGPDGLVILFDKLFSIFPEFRSLTDYRVKHRPALRGHLSDVLARATELHIACKEIGPRFRIQHGQNTYVLAKTIGSDFWVNHNVTIGAYGGIPEIGDRVTVRTGAVVVGAIKIGSGAVITANAVVATDMPADHTAYAPRTIFVPRKGEQKF